MARLQLDFLRDLRGRDKPSAELQSFCRVLETILTGSRDRAIVTTADSISPQQQKLFCLLSTSKVIKIALSPAMALAADCE